MAVSGSPTLQQIVAEFGGPGNLRAYARGGSYVPNVPQNGNISTDPNALTLSQFANAVRYLALSATASSLSSSASNKGTYTVGTSFCSVSGGNGNVTYSLSFVSGTQFNNSVAGNQATFTAVNTNSTPTSSRGTYRWTVSDGISSATADFTVSWN